MASNPNQAIIQITGDDRLLDGILGRVVRKMHAWGVEVQSVVKSSIKGIGDISGFEGLGGITSAINSAKSYAAALLLVQQQSSLSAGQVNELRAKIDALALTSGASQREILAGVTEFHQVTGDYEMAVRMMSVMAEVAKATKTEMTDVADASAALMRNFKISDVDQMKAAFDIITTQASMGKVEVRDYAKELAGLAGAADKFSAKGVTGIAELGALLQTAAQVYGKPDEAATAMKLTLNAIYNRAAKLKEAGVDIFSPEMGGDVSKGVAGDPLKITRAIVAKIPPAKLGEILGLRQNVGQVIQSLRTYSELTDKFVNMQDAVGAVDARMKNYTDSAIYGFDQFNASLTKTVNDLFLDKLQSIANLFGVIAKYISYLADHPITGFIPALIAYKGLPSMLATAGLSMASRGSLGPGGMAGFGQVTNVFIAGAAPGVLNAMGGGGVPGVGGSSSGGKRMIGPSAFQIGTALITAGAAGWTIGSMIATILKFNDMTGDNTPGPDIKKYGVFAEGQVENQAEMAGVSRSLADTLNPLTYVFGHSDRSQEPGSAAQAFPGRADTGDMSAKDYAKLMRAQIDGAERLAVIMEKAVHLAQGFKPGYGPPLGEPTGSPHPSRTNVSRTNGGY